MRESAPARVRGLRDEARLADALDPGVDVSYDAAADSGTFESLLGDAAAPARGTRRPAPREAESGSGASHCGSTRRIFFFLDSEPKAWLAKLKQRMF